MEGSTAITLATKPKSKTKGNKKPEKEKDPKAKTTKAKGKETNLNYSKFEGQGLNYRCKLFGYAEVPGPRGDNTCVEAIQKLKQQAKQQKKGANEHKLKIIFNITLQGIKVINEKTQNIEHEHQIHKISFISHDPDDRHIFGYIYSPPRTTDKRKYYLFAVKAEKSADAITCQLYELFQVVYKMQENKKTKMDAQKPSGKSSAPLEPLQDKMLSEMSSRLGGEQQYAPDEHLYAEPIFVKRSPPVSPKAHYAIPSGRPAYTPNNSESRECESHADQNKIKLGKTNTSGRYNETNAHEKNGEVKREIESTGLASSSFAQDPFTPSSTEDNQFVSDKEASVQNMQSSLASQTVSDNIFTPNEDSGFELDFDSAVSSISTEPKLDDSFQFEAEFSAIENGFSSSKSDLKDENHSEETDVLGADKHGFSSPDQFQPDAFKSGAQFENTFDINNGIENNDKESDQVNFEVTDVSTSKSNNKSHFESEGESECTSTFSADDIKPDIDSPVDVKTSNSPHVSLARGNITQENEPSDTKIENRNVSFGSADLFETKFDAGNDEKNAKKSVKDTFSSFSSNSQAFTVEDPFSSFSPTEQDKSFGVFPVDDPFSPQGGTNTETVSNPFAESDDIFGSDFNSTMKNNDVFNKDKENVLVSQTNREAEKYNNEEEDVYEAMFEATMEKEMEDIDEEQNDTVPSMVSREINVKINEQANTGNENAESNGAETPSEDSQNDKIEDDVSMEVSEKNVVQDVPREEQKSGMNTFDLTTNDEYVTLKKAAQNETRPLSPTGLAPPPLPPRPTPPFNFERSDYEEIPQDVDVLPKEPPALPPRPSNQSIITEPAIRQPPELPPRVDLEEINSDPFSDNAEDTTESTQNDAPSPLFQSNFDSFDFSNAENRDETIELQESSTAEFDIGDPFKDPFVGADPFQTPNVADPFSSSSPSFVQRYKQRNDGFDPFSDDPFATTPSFDTQSSFDLSNSSFPAQPSFEEPKEDQDNVKKFADFSSSFS